MISQVLTDGQIQRIHDASMSILERVGVHVPHEDAVTRLEAAGAKVDRDAMRVRIPEDAVMRAVGQAMPNVTPVLVREQIVRVSDSLAKLGAATRWGALAVLLTGLAVLVGTAAAGEERRRAEAAILKVLGATRATILASFALRAALTGLIAALVALVWATASAFGVITYVFETDYIIPVGNSVLIVLGGIGLSLAAGLFFAQGPLRARPARVLREAAG